MNVLGVNAYHGDVSAVLVADGDLVAAVEEERFRRIKHCAGFPANAIAACLQLAGISGRDIDLIAVSRDPRAHWWRKALFLVQHRPRRTLGDRARHLIRVRGIGSALHVDQHVFFPHSIGLLYLAITQFLGFPRYGDEFKVMGLAPYGELRYVPELRNLIRLGADGQFQLDLSYFSHWSDGVQMTWDDGEPTIGPVFTPKLEALVGPRRRPDDPLEPRHEAIAASLQAVFEDAVIHVLRHVRRATGADQLCLAGGCAMNSVANGKIRERTGFRDVFIQPAAGDNGTALGAAFHAWHSSGDHPRRFVMRHSYWGPAFQDREVVTAIRARSTELAAVASPPRAWDDEAALDAWTAERIADGRVVGWYQGRMEWGARALGNRSILADPRRGDMREIINTRIKFRERFRPFAPSILESALSEYFDDAVPDPFMLQVYPVRSDKRAVVPAITHVDGSGRLQTVSEESNPRYARLIAAFERRTGVPVLLNTSFNENEPIVLRPQEALDCFLRTRMDVLVMGRHSIERRPEA